MPPKEKKVTKNQNASQSPAPADTSKPAPDSSTTAARSNERYEEIRDGFTMGFGAAKDASEATELLAPLKATCALLVRGLEMTKSINDNKKAWVEFRDRLKGQSEQFKDEVQKQQNLVTARKGAPIASPSLPALERYLKELQDTLERVQGAASYSQPGFSGLVRRVARSRVDPEEIKRWTARLDDAYKRYTGSLLLVLSEQVGDGNQRLVAIHEIVKNPASNRQTSRPMKYHQDSLNTSIYGLDLDICDPGTQVDVLGRIRQWADDRATRKQIFWLSGGKGTGKTTITATMSREWENKGILGGRFFFSPDSRATYTTTEFCPAVARDMAAHIEPLRTEIHAAIKKAPSGHFPLEYQFQRMIVEPLEQYGEPIFIVIDGLESVPNDIMRDHLLRTLLAELPRVSTLKVLFSSEPVIDIEDRLGTSDLVEHRDISLPDSSDGTIDRDIKLYIESNLHELTEPQKATVAALSRGHFLWLAPATVMLQKSRMKDELIQHMIRENSPNHVDGLYCIALQQAEHAMWPQGLKMDLMRVVIGVLEPVPLITLCLILRIPQKRHFQVFTMVRTSLAGLLKAGDPNSSPVRVRHSDFRDFCLDSLRSKEFYVDSFISHSYLALTCLELLDPLLGYNILGVELQGVLPWNDELSDLDIELEKFLKAHPTAAYASSYWPYHMAIALQNQELHSPFTRFLTTQLLHWLEFMSWRGCVDKAIDGLSYLQRALHAHLLLGPEAVEMETLTAQALYFTQRNGPVVERSALQVYCSALGFASEDGTLVRKYREMYKGKSPRVVVVKPLPSKVHRSLGKPSSVLEISPDGHFVATVSRDFTISLWMSSTRDAYEKRLSGHKAEITSLSFSGDNLFLASGSMDGQIQIWNIATGCPVHLIDQPDAVIRVSFSVDASVIAIISKGARKGSKPMLRVWNSATGPGSGDPSVRFTCKEPFGMATFSPDGAYIAAMTDNGLIQVFNVTNGMLHSTVNTNIHAAHIAVSSDGRRVAISNNVHIQLWDVSNEADPSADEAGSKLEPLATMPITIKGNEDALSISHNGRYLIHASTVWRIDTLPATLWSTTRLQLPPGLRWYATGPGSLLSYEEGWIHSAHPQGRLVEVPLHCGIDSSTPWRAHGSKLVFARDSGEIVVVDCSPLLSVDVI